MLSEDQPTPHHLRTQIIIVSVILIVLIGLAVVLRVFQPPANHHLITFRVESTSGFAIITYKDSHLTQVDGLNVPTPWERTWDNPSGAEVYLTAGNPADIGKVKCYLRLDGRNWKTMESSTSVACGGIVP